MKTLNKIIMLLLAVLLICGTGLVIFKTYEQTRMQETIQIEQQSRREQINRIIQLKQATLKMLAADYSLWDEMVNFIHRQNPVWAKENVGDAALKTYGADAVWIIAIDGTILHTAATTPARTVFPLESSQLEALFSQEKVRSFFVATGNTILEVHGATVHAVTDTNRLQPAKGYFLVAKAWDKPLITDLAKLTDSSITQIGRAHV